MVSKAGIHLAAIALLAALPSDLSAQASPAPAAADTAGWRVLFDGSSTAAWRRFRGTGLPDGWKVVDGALTRVGKAGDIVTVDQFENFELALEWKIAPGGNSGIFYRVTEDTSETYYTGPEMQVLDDAKHEDGQSRLTSAGALFGLYPSPAGIVKPAGEWNTVRLIVNGKRVEHWLNGTKVVEAELGSPDWDAKVKASKFAKWPGFGRAPRGHIALQDHDDRVAYRNIRIKVLP